MTSSSNKSYTVVVAGEEKRTYVERSVGGIWIGIFGGWYEWNGSGNGREKDDEEVERLGRLCSGVVAMEAEQEMDADDDGELLSFRRERGWEF